jgi:hypothetical protein
MTRLVATFIAIVLIWVVSTGAQSTQSNPSPAPTQASTLPETSTKPASLPKGSRLVGKLTTKVDTKHSKVGAAVVVEVTKDVKSGDQIVLSKGSLVKGTITQVQAFSKGHSNAEVQIVFDNVIPKNGQQISTHFAMFALAAKLEKQPGDVYATSGYKGLADSASTSGRASGTADTGGTADVTPQTVGIFGFDGVELHPLVTMTPPTAGVNSSSGNIVLDSGTLLVLESMGQ